jgi:predicted nucleic acid-binding Zn ribbon protein
MTGWMFTVLAWVLVATGVFIAWRFGWRDPGKGTRRCPKCGYDMTATSGLRCSECGHQALSEKRLRRRRIRRRWIVIGAMVALVSWFPFKWPEYQRLTKAASGPLAFVPKSVLVLAWPWVADWQDASLRTPKKWWAKSDPRMQYNLHIAVDPDSLWEWQRALLLSRTIAALRTPHTHSRFMWASIIAVEKRTPDEETLNAYLDGYLAAPSWWRLRILPAPHRWFDIPPQYRERVRDHLVRHPQILSFDVQPLSMLNSLNVPIDDVVFSFLASRPTDAVFERVAVSLAQGRILPESARGLLERLHSSQTANPRVVHYIIRSDEPHVADFRAAIDRAMQGASSAERGQIVTALGLIPSGDSRIDEMLRSYRCDPHHEVEFAADLALATRAGDTERLRMLVQQADRWISEPLREYFGPKSDILRASLIECGSRGTWPMPLRLEALWIVIESVTNSASEVDGLLAVNAVIRLGDGYRPEAVNFFAQRFRERHRVGLWAWHAYLGSEYVPREMLSAAQDSLAGLEGRVRAARVRQIAQAETKVR